MPELLEFISSEILLYEKSGESEHDAENFATSMLALCIAVCWFIRRFSDFPLSRIEVMLIPGGTRYSGL